MNLLRDMFVYNPDQPFLFTQLAFWLYFAIVYLLFTLCYKNITQRNYLLFLVSMFFYYKTGGLFVLLLIFSILVNYLFGIIIHKSERALQRKLWLTVGVVLNLSVLFYYKYAYFIADSLNNVFGTDFKVRDYIFVWSNNIFNTHWDVATIVLPVGISFFTFQGLSYLIDIYKKQLKPLNDILEFGFFKSFFPQLVAGPIVRASDFIPQISKKFSLSKEEFGHALFLIMNGLIKKMVISDYISLNFVDRVFDNPHMFSGIENLLAVYGYAIQIYCDFSGYTDIAIGLALLMGFRIPINFNSPYKAHNLVDFWRRWHISLSKWLRDYLYIPLGGNRKGEYQTHLNLLITMLLGGLWHGANIKFIIWGALHGVGLAVNKIVFGIKTNRNVDIPFWQKAGGWLITFHFVCFAWIFFRADSMNTALSVISNIFTRPDFFLIFDIIRQYSTIFLILGAGFCIHWLPTEWKEKYRGAFIRQPMAVKFITVLFIGLLLYQFKTSDLQPFIYFQF
jgi:alginate O-acetyltransferase complex protein AlgI